MIFIAGMALGNHYQMTDLLCSKSTELFKLDSDFISDNGIVFPKGTVIPIRQCAYMQRFKWSFAISNSVQLSPAEESTNTDYGFSELQPVER